jgi:hypothetical protein
MSSVGLAMMVGVNGAEFDLADPYSMACRDRDAKCRSSLILGGETTAADRRGILAALG